MVCAECGNIETNSNFEFRCPDCGALNDAPTYLGVVGVLCEMCGFRVITNDVDECGSARTKLSSYLAMKLVKK